MSRELFIRSHVARIVSGKQGIAGSAPDPNNTFDSAAKPHQIRVFSRLREKPALKKKDLDNANSPKSAQDGGFAAESTFDV